MAGHCGNAVTVQPARSAHVRKTSRAAETPLLIVTLFSTRMRAKKARSQSRASFSYELSVRSSLTDPR